MIKEELYINGESVELIKSLNPNLTFNIADIAKPDTRKADHSKTIELPASKKLNKIFEHIFDLDTDLQTFNPNLKTDVIYLVDGEVQIDGYLQLKAIKNKDGYIVYNCIIIGRVGNFIAELQNAELTDLDLSSLNHNYTKANQSATWNYPLTTDYVYPMVDYGNIDPQQGIQNWPVGAFYPAIKVKKYIDSIFSSIGYQYTSTFLTSDFFNTLIVPFGAKTFKLDATGINNRIFEANTPQTVTGSTNVIIPYETIVSGLDEKIIKLTNEVSDAGNVYDNTTGVFEIQVGKAGYYSLNSMLQLQGEFTSPSDTLPTNTQWLTNANIHGTINLSVYTSGNAFIRNLDSLAFGISTTGQSFPLNTSPATITTPASPTGAPDPNWLLDYYYPTGVINIGGGTYVNATDGNNNTFLNTNTVRNHFKLNANNVYLNEGEKIKLRINYAVRRGVTDPLTEWFWATTENNVTPVTSQGSYKLNLLSGYLKTAYVNNDIIEGNNISMSSAIPRKVKQKDFFMSIVKMFNLYIQPDPNDPKNLLIEPRDDFYSSEIIDWSSKIDKSKDLMSKPMGALNNKEYLYSYKPDKDYYNQLYFDSWDEVYGQEDFILPNEFLNNEYKTEVIFSPTTSVGKDWYDRVLPTIIKFDDNNGIQRTESNIRILQWGGMKATGQQWIHLDGAGNQTYYTTYPYSGMYDDPYSPTTLLEFGLSNEIYYSDVFDKVVTFSNNTLFNKYYLKFLQEITDVNSKVVTAYFYLSPSDIKQLSFSKQYYFEGQYFRLNKVENYNPINPITKCEFLKLKFATVFSPTTGVGNGGTGTLLGDDTAALFANGSGVLNNGNAVSSLNQMATGSNNYINKGARNVNIIGDNNQVFSNTNNIEISGSNNVIESGVQNVKLINTNNQTVSNSDVTYINNQITGAGASQTITSLTKANENVQIYYCDASTASFTVDFSPTTPITIGKIWTFKKVSSSNQVTIDASTIGATIDGANTYTLNSHYKYVTIQFDGQNFLITSNN